MGPAGREGAMAEPAEKPRVEDSYVARQFSKILVLDFGSQYTQLITRRCAAAPRARREGRAQGGARAPSAHAAVPLPGGVSTG